MLMQGFISMPFAYLVLGFIAAWLCYVKYPLLPGIMQQDAKLISKILTAKYGFDALNERLVMPMIRGLGRLCWRIGDVLCIDSFMVNGTALSIGRVAIMLKNTQSGYLYHYVFIIVSGLLALLIWTIYL